MHSRMETFPMPLDDLLLNWSFISEFVQKNWSSAKDKRDFFPQSLSIVDCYADTHKNILASGSAWKKCIFPLKVATEISFVFFFLIDLRQNGMWTHTHASSISNFFYCVPLSLSRRKMCFNNWDMLSSRERLMRVKFTWTPLNFIRWWNVNLSSIKIELD